MGMYADQVEGFGELLAARGVSLALNGRQLDCLVERDGNEDQPFDIAPGECQTVTVSLFKSDLVYGAGFTAQPDVGSYFIDSDGGRYRIKARRPNPGKPVVKFVCEFSAGAVYSNTLDPDTLEGFGELLEASGIVLTFGGVQIRALLAREANTAQAFDINPADVQTVVLSVFKTDLPSVPDIGSYFEDDESGRYRVTAHRPCPERAFARFVCEYSGGELVIPEGLCIDADGSLCFDSDDQLAVEE